MNELLTVIAAKRTQFSWQFHTVESHVLMHTAPTYELSDSLSI